VRRALAVTALLATSAVVIPADAGGPTGEASYARVTGGVLAVGNDLVERRWTLSPWRGSALVDKRTGRTVAGPGPDGSLSVVTGDRTAEVGLDTLTAGDPVVRALPDGGRRVEVPLGALLSRVIEVHPGTAGLSTSLTVTAPLALAGYTLDSLPLPAGAPAVAHAFHAGSDWREEGWQPQAAVGDHQPGDWVTHTPLGADQVVTGQWLSAGPVFQVLERVDLSSSVVGRHAGRTVVGTDLTRDVLDLGPLEGDAHVGNPGAPTGRHSLVPAGTALETVFTGVARDADDEGWQLTRWLHRSRPAGQWTRGIVWNSDSVDHNRISTGAKDDMDLAEVRRQAAVAKRLGVDYFVLDDGWQARSGDWCPDSPECPEQRPGMFPARFPDASFTAVRQAIAPMTLGLWMSAMEFHHTSSAFQRNPTWECAPLGTASTALELQQDGSSSSEAGLGVWNPLAIGPDGRLIDHVEAAVRRGIEQWGVRYYKFDFMVWADCLGVEPVDVYRYREAFVAMLDRVQRDHPQVVLQIDETNDYRLWPFESVARGATWFQNGTPRPPQLLHNLWSLAPWVPSDTLGQAALASGREDHSIDYLMAVALPSHPTFKLDLTQLTDAQVETARRWTDAYHREQDRFEGVTYPLLADPQSGRAWTGLQVWDRDTQSGVVLAYRQDDPSASAVLRLHAVDGRVYRLRDLLTGEPVATVPADVLRDGYRVSVPSTRQAVSLLVERVS
jgi:hypothetical protein